MDLDAVVDGLTAAIDERIAPERLSPQEALEVLEAVADHCRMVADGIRDDERGREDRG